MYLLIAEPEYAAARVDTKDMIRSWLAGGALYTPPPIPTGLLLDSRNPTGLD